MDTPQRPQHTWAVVAALLGILAIGCGAGWLLWQRVTPTETDPSQTLNLADNVLERAAAKRTPQGTRDTNGSVLNKVVIGYEWELEPGSPAIASTTLPIFELTDKENIGKRTYQVYLWNGTEYAFYKDAHSLETVTFPEDGVQRFKVLGIDPTYKICPEQSGYVFGVTFATSGDGKGSRYAILAPSPDGTACVPSKGLEEVLPPAE